MTVPRLRLDRREHEVAGAGDPLAAHHETRSGRRVVDTRKELLGAAQDEVRLVGPDGVEDVGGETAARQQRGLRHLEAQIRLVDAQREVGNLALPLDWGGYVLWHAAPSVKVSLDGRFATVYPPRVVEDNFAFFRGDDAADAARLLDAYDTTLVLAPRGMATPLGHRSEWQMLYTDQVAALFGKRGAPAGGSSDAPRGWMAFP